jgi:hypothetical protein
VVDPARYVGIRPRPYLDTQDLGISVEHPEVVVVDAMGMPAKAMTAFDPQDSCQRGFVPPKHSMADPVERSEGFERERLDGVAGEHDR